MTAPTTRVLIADDHPQTRQAVRAALEAGGFEVCGEAASGPAAVDAVLRDRPDVALLDVQMPGGNGIVATSDIMREAPDTAVVILTVSRDDADLFDALRAGARGYLLKDIDPERLPAALRAVLDGEAALPRGLVARLIDEFRARETSSRRHRPPGRLARLTEREWEVLDLMRQGSTTQEIATTLYVSPVTVRTHVSAILRKLQVPDRATAIRVAETGES